METLKRYFDAFAKDVKDNAIAVIILAIIVNLFVKLGIGCLFAVALIAFAVHAIYTRFVK